MNNERKCFMKKFWLMMLIVFYAIGLVACGAKDEETLEKKIEQLTEENKKANETIAQLVERVKELETELNGGSDGQTSGTIPEDEKLVIQIIRPDDQLLSYHVEKQDIRKGELTEEIKQALAIAVSDIPVNAVKDNGDGTVTIDFDQDYVSGPNMTSSAQVGVFMDSLKYVMYENFPKVKAYYLQADGEPTAIGETSVYTEAIANEELKSQEMYLEIKE